jgi:alginate O-acetyltransferase complex protein AlgI
VNFVSWAFVAVFALAFYARLTIGRRKVEPGYVAVLIATSALFYGWHVPGYLLILGGTAALDYGVALAMGRLPATDRRTRRRWLLLSVVANLGVLGLFKYGGFAARVVADLAAVVDRPVQLPELALVLPMGISFYTFQTLSYTVDVYRGQLVPVRSFWRFFLFVGFFPQLVAGPIVRASEFLPQIDRPRRLRLRVFYEGTWLLISGFFLKMVCADNLAAYVDEHWDRATAPQADATFALWVGVMFSGQIFADFCGYSTIARGLGYLLGFRFPINFAAPYVAGTFKNFWERWHITLSRWLRDYLYVPLGGSRGSRPRTLLNLLLVMLLGGLWHGAAYTFIAWGAIHGLCLVIERLLGLHRDDGPRRHPAVRLAWFVVVQAAVLVAWVFFRSDSLAGAVSFVGNLVAGRWTLPAPWMLAAALFLAPLVAMHLWTWLHEHGRVAALGPTRQALLAAAMTYGIVTMYAGTSDFIYFQF